MHKPGNSNKPIHQTGMSRKFIVQSESMGILTLSDFIHADIPKLCRHPNYSEIWFTEMLRLLKLENLLDEFQQGL